MKSYFKILLGIIICVLIHVNLVAQDALVAEVTNATIDPGQCEDAIVDLRINGGIQPYDVHWTGSWGLDIEVFDITGNDDGEDLYNIRPGTYTVVVTDALCGTAELSVEVGCEECPPLILGIDHHGFIQCEGAKGKLTVILTDEGVPPYIIEWSNGENTETIENLDEGYYDVTVTDSRGCMNSQGIYLLVQDPAIELYEDQDLVVVDNCSSLPANGSISFINPLGSGYNYSWTGPNGFTSNSQNITGLEAGIYCVKVGTLDSRDCIYAKGCVEVSLVPGPSVILSDIQNIPLCKRGNDHQLDCMGTLTVYSGKLVPRFPEQTVPRL